MKKMYYQPACLVVALGTCQMVAASLPVDDTVIIEDPNDILTKEKKSIWDDEW